MMDDKELRLKIAEANNWDIAKAIEVYAFVSGSGSVNDKKGVVSGSGLQIGLFKTDKGVAIKSNICPTFVVSLHDATEYPIELCSEDTEGNKYYEREVDVIFDYDGKSDTAALPLNEEIKLKDGEYIPSLGQLVLMCKVKNELNRMLEECGGDVLEDIWYWSSSEYSGSNAWLVSLSNGYLIPSSSKSTYQNRVRPVSAFSL
jgi:hypothetical protein